MGGLRYEVGSGLTAIDQDVAPLLDGLPTEPIDICRVAQALVLLPDLASGLGLPEERLQERSVRPASDILRVLREHDERPLVEERSLGDRVVGTCRHFAVLTCALLRHRGAAARARCGFAAYFSPGQFVDHWVIEVRAEERAPWVRLDPEILGFDFVPDPTDLQPGEFLTGGEAWVFVRKGAADPSRFGVHGVPDNFGIGEIRGNAVRDLAALNKVEVLPWDEWGRMPASYEGTTGADYDALMDRLALTCAEDDPVAVAALYATEDLAVPASLVPA